MSLQLQRKTKYASCLMFLSMTQTIFIWELEHNLKTDLHPLACRVFSWRILDIGEQCSSLGDSAHVRVVTGSMRKKTEQNKEVSNVHSYFYFLIPVLSFSLASLKVLWPGSCYINQINPFNISLWFWSFFYYYYSNRT